MIKASWQIEYRVIQIGIGILMYFDYTLLITLRYKSFFFHLSNAYQSTVLREALMSMVVPLRRLAMLKVHRVLPKMSRWLDIQMMLID